MRRSDQSRRNRDELDLVALTEARIQHYLDVMAEQGWTERDLYQRVMQEVEVALLRSVMASVDNHQTQASEILGISRTTLRTKLVGYGLHTPGPRHMSRSKKS